MSPDTSSRQSSHQLPVRNSIATGWLYDVEKRGGGVVRAQITSFKQSAPFLDIRLYVKKDDELRATQKGVTIPLANLRALAEALTALSCLEGSASP